MSTKYKVLCGVPKDQCQGAGYQTDQHLGTNKAHANSTEAFKCYAHYLVTYEGYTRIGSREFRKDGHPVLVLTKKSRFGGRLRMGKEGSRYQPGGAGTRQGLIIG